MDIHQVYFWEDSRIHIDDNHTFWNAHVDHLALDGEFVERCLWTPGLQFKDLNELSIVRPTPASSNRPPLKVVLGSTGIIQIILRNVQLTVSCYMDFDSYPFDQQVLNSGFADYSHNMYTNVRYMTIRVRFVFIYTIFALLARFALLDKRFILRP